MFVPAVGIALVPGFVQMTLQLFFGITPAPPDSAHLLGRWRPAMTILIMAVLRLPVPGRLRGVLGLLLTHKGIVPPGNRPREDQFLPETQRTPPRRAQAPRHGDAYVQSRRMTKGNDIREITDKAGRDYFIGPDRSYYALLAGLVSTGSESGIARYRPTGASARLLSFSVVLWTVGAAMRTFKSGTRSQPVRAGTLPAVCTAANRHRCSRTAATIHVAERAL
jgi:hypothetical protein